MNAGLSPDVRAAYADGFERTLSSEQNAPPWLVRARKDAFDAFLDRGWPKTTEEDWRFTDVSPLTRLALMPSPVGAPVSDGAFDDGLVHLGRGLGHRLLFRDGRHDPGGPSWLQPPEGLIVAPLSSATHDEATQVQAVLGRHVQDGGAFVALNTAFYADGAFIHIPPGLVVEAPIFVVHLAGAEAAASFPRTVVWAEKGSQATVVEVFLGADGRVTFSDAVSELAIEAGARLAYHAIQKPSPQGFHVGHLAVTQRAGSTFFAHSLSLDGRLVRNDAHLVLADEGGTCRLDGITVAARDSHIDNQTSIDHRAPKCTSRESYKSVVAGRGQSVWTGRAIVRPGAQGTDARQSSRNLILDDGAVVHAKPHLEIFANDVKCSHGATTGRLDPEALFYLRSRGIGAKEANQMLISAFLREGLGRVADARLRGELEAVLAERTRDLSAGKASP